MANLYLTCKACRRSFFSGVQAPPPEPRTHECMWCHEAPEYGLEDFFVGYSDDDLRSAEPVHPG